MNHNRIRTHPHLTEAELTEVIKGNPQQPPYLRDSGDLMVYFFTDGKQFEPSWKFMDRNRMKEIFHCAIKKNWCTDFYRGLIQSALTEMDATAH